jgi:uncharacterized delta-60 repeat protein
MKNNLLLLIFTALLFQFASAQDGANDFTFNTFDNGSLGNGSAFNDEVQVVVMQPDGKALVGGNFTSFNGTAINRLARLNVNGTLDTTFNIGTGFSNKVWSIYVQSDGKIVVGGQFAFFNDSLRYGVVRLNANGSLDTSFDTGTGAVGAFVYSICGYSNGKILLGGDFYKYNEVLVSRMVRLNPDGSLDGTFTAGAINQTVRSMVIQSNGKIIIGGAFSTLGGYSAGKIGRLNADGSIDNSFNYGGAGFNNDVRALALQSDGKILVGGSFTTYNGATGEGVVRLDADGGIDASFSTKISNVYTIALHTNGKIIVGGAFGVINSVTRHRIGRLNADGTLDTTFDPLMNFHSNVYSVAVQSDGKVIAGGAFVKATIYGTGVGRIGRLNENGSFDASYATGAGFNSDNVHAIVVQPDGKILVGGSFGIFNGALRNRLARLNPDGSVDTSFDTGLGFNSTVRSIVVRPDGKILVAGAFTGVNNIGRQYLVRMNANGTRDDTYTHPGFGFDGAVHSIALQSDGRIIAGGNFNNFTGTVRRKIARVGINGSLDYSYFVAGFDDGIVNSVAIQSDDKVIAGGTFTAFNGTTRSGIARLNTDGTLDNTFTPGLGFVGEVHTVVIQSNGKILVGGNFNSFDGTAVGRIVRLNTDGSLDNAFNINTGVGFDSIVSSIALQSDGKILVGGSFLSFNETAVNRIVRLNADGSLDTSFDPGTGFNNSVLSVAVQSNGRILAGGEFTSYNGIVRNRIARILNCSTSASGIDVVSSCGPYTWIDGVEYTTNNSTAMHTILGGATSGCDSLVVLNLTINSGTFSAYTETACESFSWKDTTYTTGGVKLYTYTNANGCPSVDTLHLTINHGTHNVDTQTACESYDWNGTTYTTGGTKLYTYTNGNGCPSVDTLYLTINNGTHNVDTQTACESYDWNGTTYTTGGVKVYAYTNANGCPSVDTLYLTINTVDVAISVNNAELTVNQSGASYQWIDCGDNDAPIAGETAQTFTATTNGSYAVEVTANGCVQTSSCIAVNFAEIKEVESNTWNVYPNPSNGIFVISTDQLQDNALLEVYGQDGRLIYSTIYSGTEATVDLKNESRGVYILRVNNEKYFRIIKN